MAGMMSGGEFGVGKRVTASAAIASVAGRLLGFYVAETSSGTLVLRDGGASGTQLTGTITPAVGWHGLPIAFNAGLHATIGGSALDVTLVVN
jgi:hypothetical protein